MTLYIKKSREISADLPVKKNYKAGPPPEAVKKPEVPAGKIEVSPKNIPVDRKKTKEPEEKKEPETEKIYQPTRKIAFTIFSSKAKKVSIVGSFNNWDPARHALQKNGGNKWTITLSLAPGQHFYQFVVDGKRIKDPNNSNFWEIPGRGECSAINLKQQTK